MKKQLMLGLLVAIGGVNSLISKPNNWVAQNIGNVAEELTQDLQNINQKFYTDKAEKLGCRKCTYNSIKLTCSHGCGNKYSSTSVIVDKKTLKNLQVKNGKLTLKK